MWGETKMGKRETASKPIYKSMAGTDAASLGKKRRKQEK